MNGAKVKLGEAVNVLVAHHGSCKKCGIMPCETAMHLWSGVVRAYQDVAMGCVEWHYAHGRPMEFIRKLDRIVRVMGGT